MDQKKLYYYIICLVSLFIFFWGVVDLAGAVVGFGTTKSPAVSAEQSIVIAGQAGNDQYLDSYYQRKMLLDQFSFSLARIVVAGAIFFYCRNKVEKLEG